MDVSVNWLRALVPGLQGTPEELADALSTRAVPVDRVLRFGEGLEDIVVARVLSTVPHPNADRLTLCQVDAGSADPLDVVCGAPVVEEGGLYPYVPVGGTLPGGLVIESREIRGERSHGMLCSEKELGLGRDASGILRLPDGYRPGQPLAQALDLPDARLEIDLTPNRIDLACHVGVARELAPNGQADITLPDFGGPAWTPEWVSDDRSASACGVVVTIEDPERCTRYLAAVVRGVRVGPSPDWLRARLQSVGTRSVNNVVDATNYVLLELNQPLHAFDLAALRGSEIRVRAAREEALTTLDGQDHELGPVVTVIADAERPVALAGVMGGADSEVSDGTTDLLIECAAFDPRHTRRTARATRLATDASYRFERGIDELGLEAAVTRCVELILATAGGVPEPQAIRVGRQSSERRRVRVRPSRVRQLLGLRLSADQIAGLLRPLGFETAREGEAEGEALQRDILVEVPGWRVDVHREVDLLEEVARRYGYESFPHEPRSFRPSAVSDSPVWEKADVTRRALAAMGFLEARSSSFVGETPGLEGAVELLNPLSAAERFLRTDLVPVLIARLEHNYARARRNVRLFEIGTVFGRRRSEGPHETPFAEEMRIGLLLTGLRAPRGWSSTAEDFDVWDLKGTLEELSERLGLGVVRADEPPDDESEPRLCAAGWLGGERFCIFDSGRLVGVAGRVRPEAVDAPPWAAPVWGAEIRLAAVRAEGVREFRPLPSFPSVWRDLSLTVPQEVAAGAVAEAFRDGAPEALESVHLFDLYEGETIEAGRKSLAWRLVFRAPDRTLTDEEVETYMATLISTLEKRFDVRIRAS